jgi:putative membrane protein
MPPVTTVLRSQKLKKELQMARIHAHLTLVLLSCIIGTGLTPGSFSARADITSSSSQSTPIATKSYVDKAAAADLFEIESSKLALEQSKNSNVRAFAQMMIHDHTASTTKLKATLKKEKADGPPAVLDPEHQTQLDSLKSQSGESFDNAYVKAQLKGHQDALALHQNYAASGADKELKAFAASTAKIVETHLTHIEALAKKLNVSG